MKKWLLGFASGRIPGNLRRTPLRHLVGVPETAPGRGGHRHRFDGSRACFGGGADRLLSPKRSTRFSGASFSA